MLRRVTAMLAMLALIGLLLLLIWHVEMHHEHGASADEPAVVSLSSPPGVISC
ncbi:MAG TPA: hypothetical protein VNN08_19235 [Thermoanaerobaculia bacterium]|nr:hypothetical protein [Thermoanaerobaculia bacterium]